MINILIADDSQEKQKNIKKKLNEYFANRQDVCVVCVQDVVNAKKEMLEKNIDILILDLYLPLIYEDGPDKKGGISLINQTYKSIKYKYPDCVISISRYKSSMREFKKETGKIHRTIFYDDSSTSWEDELTEVLDFVVPCIENNIFHRCYQYDLAIVCAMEEELQFVKNILTNIKQLILPFDETIYFEGVIEKEDKEIKVIVANAFQMGMAAMASLTTNIINHFIPQYIVMTGIAAGIKSMTNLGDAVVAEFTWDYGAGKDILDDNGFRRHLNTVQPIQTNPTILSRVRILQQDKLFLGHIEEGFDGKVPDTKFKIVIGPMATGAAVIADPEKVQSIMDNQIRNVVAIEMEAYGMYYAANWSVNPKPQFFAIKSICDFADQKKNDDFHEYASYTSVKVLEKLVKEYLDF